VERLAGLVPDSYAPEVHGRGGEPADRLARDVALGIALDATGVPDERLVRVHVLECIFVRGDDDAVGDLSLVLLVGVQGPEEANRVGVDAEGLVEGVDAGTDDLHGGCDPWTGDDNTGYKSTGEMIASS
jgi:hypothetical protein